MGKCRVCLCYSVVATGGLAAVDVSTGRDPSHARLTAVDVSTGRDPCHAQLTAVDVSAGRG